MQDTPDATNSADVTPAGELAAPGAQETSREAATSLEERLKKAELAAAEHHDAWLRAKAEADNIR
jgi:molecular chaperone GrpE